MAPRDSHQKIVRTPENLQFEIETDEPWEVRGSAVGELVRNEQPLALVIRRIAVEILDGLQAEGLKGATARFGISLSAAGGYFLTKGQSDAHVVIELEMNRNVSTNNF